MAGKRPALLTPKEIDAARRALSLVDLVGKIVKLRKSGKEWTGLCPFHHEKSPSFKVSEDRAHCFGCGWHGDALAFIRATQGLTFRQAVASTAQSVSTLHDNAPATGRMRPGRGLDAGLAQYAQATPLARFPPGIRIDYQAERYVCRVDGDKGPLAVCRGLWGFGTGAWPERWGELGAGAVRCGQAGQLLCVTSDPLHAMTVQAMTRLPCWAVIDPERYSRAELPADEVIAMPSSKEDLPHIVQAMDGWERQGKKVTIQHDI